MNVKVLVEFDSSGNWWPKNHQRGTARVGNRCSACKCRGILLNGDSEHDLHECNTTVCHGTLVKLCTLHDTLRATTVNHGSDDVVAYPCTQLSVQLFHQTSYFHNRPAGTVLPSTRQRTCQSEFLPTFASRVPSVPAGTH